MSPAPVDDFTDLVNALEAAGCTVRGRSVVCAFHGDSNASGSIYQGPDGRWRYRCHACDAAGDAADIIARHTGRPLADVLRERAPVSDFQPRAQPKPTPAPQGGPALFASLERLSAAYYQGRQEAIYKYQSPTGADLLAVLRLPGKNFRQATAVPGGWVARGMSGGLPIYRQPELAAADPAAVVVVTEGEKDADSLHTLGILATSAPMGADSRETRLDNDGKPGKALWGLLAGRSVVLWGDDDEPGQRHMVRVARILGRLKPAPVLRVIRPEDRQGCKDAADLIHAHGPEAARLAVAQAVPWAEPEAEPADAAVDADGDRPRIVIRSHADRLRDRAEPPDMLVEGLLPVGGLGALISLPGVGKTLCALALGDAVAAGAPFAGRVTRPGRVLYACPDSPASTERRMLAIPEAIAAKIDTVADLPPMPGSIPDIRAIVESAAATGAPYKLLVCDTWDASRSHSDGGWAGQDALLEEIMRGLRSLAADCGLAVLVLHHATRGDAGRARGSVVFDARCDWIARIDADGGNLSLVTTKSRDGEAGPVGSWRIVPVPVRGVPVATLEPLTAGEAKRASEGRAEGLDGLMTYLAGRDGVPTSRGIREALGLSGSVFDKLVAAARSKGWMEAKGYGLTDAGRGHADDLICDDWGVPASVPAVQTGTDGGTAVPAKRDSAGREEKDKRPTGTDHLTSGHCPACPTHIEWDGTGRGDGDSGTVEEITLDTLADGVTP